MRKETRDRLFRDDERVRTLNVAAFPVWVDGQGGEDATKVHDATLISVNGTTAIVLEYCPTERWATMNGPGFEVFVPTPNSIAKTRKALGLPE